MEKSLASWTQTTVNLLPKNACHAGNPRVDYSAALFPRSGVARADGNLRNLLERPSRVDRLAVADWAMALLQEIERCDFWERYKRARSP